MARSISTPEKQTLPIRVINLDPLPVTLHKNTKIAHAKIIREGAICSASEQGTERDKTMTKEVDLQHPLLSNLTDKQKEQFFALTSEYSDVIAQGPNDLGRTEVLQHHIDTKDAIPIQQQARRVPLRNCTEAIAGNVDQRIQKSLGISYCLSQQKGWNY